MGLYTPSVTEHLRALCRWWPLLLLSVGTFGYAEGTETSAVESGLVRNAVGIVVTGPDLEYRVHADSLAVRFASRGVMLAPFVAGVYTNPFETMTASTVATGVEAGVTYRPFRGLSDTVVAGLGVGIAVSYQRVIRLRGFSYPDGYEYREFSLTPSIDWLGRFGSIHYVSITMGIPGIPIGASFVTYRNAGGLSVFPDEAAPGWRFLPVRAPFGVAVGWITP